jgi:hypothetical protein
MNTISDETLNKYLDGELSKEESIEVERIVNNSPSVKLRLSALKEVDRSLKVMPLSEIRFDFTAMIMKRIQWIENSKKSQKRFIIVISTIFMSLCLAIVGLVGFEMVKNYNPSNSKAITESVKYAKSVSEMITAFLNNTNMTIVGGVFSFGLLISAYFFFDYSKLFRKVRK